MNFDFYNVFTILIVLTAVFSYISYRFTKLPAVIVIMIISLLTSLAMVIIGSYYPSFLKDSSEIVKSLDFENVLMRSMLGFLLFAGALHVDINKLKKELTPIVSFATIGVIISTASIGAMMYFIFQLFSISIPFIYCLLFGALISPTDPIAALGILRRANIPSSLEIKVTGESLFNDGVGVVVFTAIFETVRIGSDNISLLQVSLLFLREAGGGVLWGIILGYTGFYFIRSINHYQVEVLITLALVMGGYLFASVVHLSGPIAMVVAGIIIGNQGMKKAMSEVSRDYLNKFWELIDEMLNAILFILIGFEMLVVFARGFLWVSLIAIPVVLLARWLAVSIPIFVLSYKRAFEKNSIAILTWGGLRGGISVALALSLPADMYRHEFLSITYIVVIFSIIVQGLTIGKIAKKLASS
jgi:CPA1 family monovalent cation:H+ antiporter